MDAEGVVHLAGTPKLEYLKTGMKKKESNEIVRFILSNNNTQTGHLLFLCMSQAPKRSLWVTLE
jgi:hypothetical protein